MGTLDILKKRLDYYGGSSTESRMIAGKLKSFEKALNGSYQACSIEYSDKTYKVLINPDMTTPNYDDKIISSHYSIGLKGGDIVKWIETNTYWLIYEQQLTEDAYFRSTIRRCKYQLKWLNEDKIMITSWAYIEGPGETTINNVLKADIALDQPTLKINIYLPKNEQTINVFKRYYRFSLNNQFWQIQSVDSISQEGVLEISAIEDSKNESKDNEIVDGLVVEPIAEISEIMGEQLIQPMTEYTYTIDQQNGFWGIEGTIKNLPVELTTISSSQAKIKWTDFSSRNGKFILKYSLNGDTYEKNIQVDSLFK